MFTSESHEECSIKISFTRMLIVSFAYVINTTITASFSRHFFTRVTCIIFLSLSRLFVYIKFLNVSNTLETLEVFNYQGI